MDERLLPFISHMANTMRTLWIIPLVASSFFLSCDELTGPAASHWFLQREKRDDITYYSINFSSATEGWIVGYSGTIEHSSDGGTTWHPQQSGVSSNLWDVCFVNSQTGWICGAGNTILRTSDGGGSWQNISPADADGSIYVSIRFIDGNIGWMSSNSGELLRSTDGGASWEVMKRFILTARLVVLDANIVYAYIGKLYRTSDGGSTWDSVAVTIPKNYMPSDMFFADAHHGWITTQNGTGGMMIEDYPVVMTENSGVTWSSSDLLTDGGLGCVHFVTAKVGWVAGGRNIYKTIDGGRHWTLDFSPANGMLMAKDIFFLSEECGWVINWSGQVYKCSGSL